MKSDNTKLKLHPRNHHRARYDFEQLMQSNPVLANYVAPNTYGETSIDFANPLAVKALNQALLNQFYGVSVWDIPKEYLCPPIPGRADYMHYAADLLSALNAGQVPLGEQVRVLDIGVGANVIYPLIGHHAYGWHFLGADIEAKALQNAQTIIDANALSTAIELRLQRTTSAIFKDIIQKNEAFSLTICNPPFHGSLAEAQAGSERKWQALGKNNMQARLNVLRKDNENKKSPRLNFGGQSAELYCEGGEEAFVTTMINESTHYATQCLWFTTLISKAANLHSVYRTLKKVNAYTVKTIEMAQGQKQSRFVAWTFLDDSQQRAWAATYFTKR